MGRTTDRNYTIVGIVDELPEPAGGLHKGRPANPQLQALLDYARRHPGQWVQYESDSSSAGGNSTFKRHKDFKVAIRQGKRYVSYQPQAVAGNGNGQHAEG